MLRSGGTGSDAGSGGNKDHTGGAIRTGGTTITGGNLSTGGIISTGGIAPSGGTGGADPAVNSCENPLPLRCGDRVSHSTLVQGRADTWRMYACTERLMSGQETIYALQAASTCHVSVQLKNPSAELFLFRFTRCDPMACASIPVSPLTFTVEPGQANFLVVDGYDGATGSYSLEVDCDCNPDAGTRDAPAPADADDGPPAIAPGATVSCEGRTCTNATGPCCPATEMMSRVGVCSTGCSVAVTCDGPDDCAPGTVCCSLESSAGFAGTACVQAEGCTSPSRVICRQPADCPASQTCGRPNPLPMEISSIPTVKPVAWRINYQVCAP